MYIKSLRENKYKWDLFTIEILNNFFNELDNTIGKFIDVKLLFKRFIESDNLKNGIEVIDDELIDDKYDAVYRPDEYKIIISKDVLKSSDYSKYILFHELLHVISRHDNYLGFLKYHEYKGMGLNEGVTELITTLRNKLINYKFDNSGIYNIVVSNSYLLGNIIGFKELYYLYFYEPTMLKNILERYHMNYEEIINSFDYFIDKEVFYIKKDFDNEFINNDRILIYNYFNSFGSINNLKVFEDKIKFISKLLIIPFSFKYSDEYSIYMEIIIDKESLLNLGIDENSIDNILKKYNLYDQDKFNKYKSINIKNS